MKIRNGFVSNSSSSSFIMCTKKTLEDRNEILQYIKDHDYCVGFYSEIFDYDGAFFEIEGFLRDKIIEHFDLIKSMFEVEDGFHSIGDGTTITEDMTGAKIYSWSGYDGEGQPRFLETGELRWCGEDLIDILFESVPEEELQAIKRNLNIED